VEKSNEMIPNGCIQMPGSKDVLHASIRWQLLNDYNPSPAGRPGAVGIHFFTCRFSLLAGGLTKLNVCFYKSYLTSLMTGQVTSYLLAFYNPGYILMIGITQVRMLMKISWRKKPY